MVWVVRPAKATRQGHVVHPEPTLPFRDVRVHFPRASVQEMARETVVRVVPVAPASPSPAETGNADHQIHNATLLGINRRGQQVYEDGAENRYLVGDPEGNDAGR